MASALMLNNGSAAITSSQVEPSASFKNTLTAGVLDPTPLPTQESVDQFDVYVTLAPRGQEACGEEHEPGIETNNVVLVTNKCLKYITESNDEINA